MKKRSLAQVFALGTVLSLFSTAATAQWIAVGRKVVGRISSLTQGHSSKDSGYDVATVFLDAEAGKVYATALSLLQQNPKMKITKKDDAQRTIEFTDGEHAAGLWAYPRMGHGRARGAGRAGQGGRLTTGWCPF